MGKSIRRGSRRPKSNGRPRNRHDIRVSSDRRTPIDLRKLGRALAALAEAEAERQAMAEREVNEKSQEANDDQ